AAAEAVLRRLPLPGWAASAERRGRHALGGSRVAAAFERRAVSFAVLFLALLMRLAGLRTDERLALPRWSDAPLHFGGGYAAAIHGDVATGTLDILAANATHAAATIGATCTLRASIVVVIGDMLGR